MDNGTYLKTIKNKRYLLREGTLDEYVAREHYYEEANYTPDDVWLDIGANIGTFPVKFADRVRMIHCYEPDEDNMAMLVSNLNLNSINNCFPHTKAVVWDDRVHTEFYLNTKMNKGAHSMFVKRGRKSVVVPCVNINTVIERINPDKIKMDIEGGEYDLIKAIRRWDNIKELVFEYHISVLRDSEGVRLAELYKLLTGRGFIVAGRATGSLKKLRYTVVHCIKAD